MSFKLLAIRPLVGTSKELLKGLEKDFVYQFYNDYIFITDDVNDVTGIKYKETVPTNLYTENINISAIVGENGSGKSSLLELLYAFSHNISLKLLQNNSHFIKEELNNDTSTSYCSLAIEIYFEKNLNKIYKLSCKTVDDNCLIELHKLNSDCIFTEIKKPTAEQLFSFYTIVLNYSLYGLNSNITGNWLDKLFYKNDNYQYPIVLNPFRAKGIIDVNKELYLAQARLILNYFVIGNKDIVGNISFKNVQLYLDIDKHQYLEYNVEDKDHPIRKFPTINSFFNFLNNIFLPSSASLEMFFDLLIDVFHLPDNSFFRIKNTTINPLSIGLETHETHIYDKFPKDDDELGFEYISFLYLYKKLKKISETYETYKQYVFLFNNDKEHHSFFGVNTSTFKNYFNEKIENKNIAKYSILGKDRENLLNELYNYYQKRFMIYLSQVNSLEEKKNREYIEKLLDSFFNQNKENATLEDLITYVYTDLDDQLKDFKYNILKNYLLELAEDNSHISFKLKQVLNYFSTDLFSKIEFSKNLSNSIYNRYDVTNSEVLLNPNKEESKILSIESVPLAVLQHEITLEKDKKIIPFSGLSSGEQQLIHTFLGISYHIYNLKSNFPEIEEKNEKLCYKNVNIIFDEVELYLHPEYQRVFIKKLIDSLSFFEKDGINFNILISTHSPFILSDIPTQNILKLKQGKSLQYDNEINSFGANIHDLLADKFFLENSTMGAYAEEAIKEIIHLYHKVIIAYLDSDQKSLDKLRGEYKRKASKFNFITNNIGEIIYQNLLKNHLTIIKSKLNENEKNRLHK